MRGRNYSYIPSPPGGYGRRHRSPTPRSHSRGRELPTSPLICNLHHDCRLEDLRGPFQRYGLIKDIYLQRDYYTGKPCGFSFVQFLDPADAADVKYEMDGYVLLGREMTILCEEENRKKPSEMSAREHFRLQPVLEVRKWNCRLESVVVGYVQGSGHVGLSIEPLFY